MSCFCRRPAPFFSVKLLSLLNLALKLHVHCNQLLCLRDRLHCVSVIAVHVTCHCSCMFIALLILLIHRTVITTETLTSICLLSERIEPDGYLYKRIRVNTHPIKSYQYQNLPHEALIKIINQKMHIKRCTALTLLLNGGADPTLSPDHNHTLTVQGWNHTNRARPKAWGVTQRK